MNKASAAHAAILTHAGIRCVITIILLTKFCPFPQSAIFPPAIQAHLASADPLSRFVAVAVRLPFAKQG
jgi:hypothetical protein